MQRAPHLVADEGVDVLHNVEKHMFKALHFAELVPRCPIELTSFFLYFNPSLLQLTAPVTAGATDLQAVNRLQKSAM